MSTTTPPSERPTAGEPGADPPPVERPPTAVPADATPAGRCPYCERPLATDRLLALHVGGSHPEECTDAERARYEDARKDESDDLFVYHLKVVGGLVVLWAAFVLSYMVVLGWQG